MRERTDEQERRIGMLGREVHGGMSVNDKRSRDVELLREDNERLLRDKETLSKARYQKDR